MPYFLRILPVTALMINTMILAITIVAPTGVDARIDTTKPTEEQIIAITTEEATTCLKVPNMRIDDSAGKIISAETNRAPTKFIAVTITAAIVIAISKL